MKFFSVFGLCFFSFACTTLPKITHKKYSFPDGKAYLSEPSRPYEKLGVVRSKVNYPTLDPDSDETRLCPNYFNKSVGELVKFAEEKGANAVIQVKSVVFLIDGRREVYPQPECSDDGSEGQVLTEGIAVKWTDQK